MVLAFWRPEEINPIAIFLIHSGSRGDKILFRHPPKGFEVAVSQVHGGGATPNSSKQSTSNPPVTKSNSNSRNPSGTSTIVAVTVPQNNSNHNPYALQNLDTSAMPSGGATLAPFSSATLFGFDSGMGGGPNESAGIPVNNVGGAHVLSQLNDVILENLLAANCQMYCEQRLEIKVDSVIFVGYPCALEKRNNSLHSATGTKVSPSAEGCLSVVFALNSSTPQLAVDSFYHLAKQLSCGLRFEEYRRRYFTRQRDVIQHCADRSDGDSGHDEENADDGVGAAGGGEGHEDEEPPSILDSEANGAFRLQTASPVLSRIINSGLPKRATAPTVPSSVYATSSWRRAPAWRLQERLCNVSDLCRELREVFEATLTPEGRLNMKMNGVVPIRYFSPHKAYRVCQQVFLRPENVLAACKSLQAYHTILLLPPPGNHLGISTCSSRSALLTAMLGEGQANKVAITPHQESLLHIISQCESEPPTLARFLRALNPTKNLHELSLDGDLTLEETVYFAKKLVLQGLAIIIYPVNLSNQYVTNPRLAHYMNESNLQDFVAHFPELSLAAVLSHFSTPRCLADLQLYECTGDLRSVSQTGGQDAPAVVRGGGPMSPSSAASIVSQTTRPSSVASSSLPSTPQPPAGTTDSNRSTTRQRYSRPHKSGSSQQSSEDPLESQELRVSGNTGPQQDVLSVAVRQALERVDELEVVCWLLRHRMLVQLHTYVAFAGLPGSSKPSEAPVASGTEEVSSPQQMDHLKHLLAYCRGNMDQESLQLLTELFPYFDGHHHFESIMMRKNRKRIEIMRCIDKFSEALVTFQTFDPVAACFSGLS